MFKKLMGRVDRLLGRAVIDDEFYDELEEALLQVDTNINTATDILAELRKDVRDNKITESDAIKERLKHAIVERFEQRGATGLDISEETPTVWLFVGVNGAGKTTTIAKVAHLLKKRGFSVLMAAGDTFRAAAIEQLEVWANRIGARGFARLSQVA